LRLPGKYNQSFHIICFVSLHAFRGNTYNELDIIYEMRDGFMIFPAQRQPQHTRPHNDFMFPSRGFQQMPTRNNPIAGIMQQFMGQNQNIGHMATKGVDGLSKTLNGVQQFLRVVDTAAPIVKQYGPLVRNLPAMYRMMKAFKDIDGTDEESQTLESISLESLSSSSESYHESSVKRTREGESIPKLFI
jgi:YqfQ-like protein